MVTATDAFADWLAQARIPTQRLTPEQRGVLQAAFHFRQQCGSDYYSTRVLSHFLLHCGCGLQVAALARLLGLDRTTASRQQGLSSKQTIQAAHHRMDGRPYGKLLPRYAGPIAEFLFAHPNASRADVCDFIDRTWGVRVSRIALYHFLKKYGLDQMPTGNTATAPLPAEPARAPLPPLPPLATLPEIAAGRPVPTPAPPFSPHAPNTPAPSSSCRRRCIG
jgi:transposase